MLAHKNNLFLFLIWSAEKRKRLQHSAKAEIAPVQAVKQKPHGGRLPQVRFLNNLLNK
jgi:hypothetical protein